MHRTMLCEHLRKVDADRAELFAHSTTRKPMIFHLSRATDHHLDGRPRGSPAEDQELNRAPSFLTAEGCIKEAEQVRDGFGEVFPPLPQLLLGGTPEAIASSAR